MSNDARPKPRLLVEPGAYLRRQVRLKLNDGLRGLKLKVTDTVDMSRMRTETAFQHVLDVGVATGTPDLYARFPGAILELFEPAPQFHPGLAAGILRERAGRLHKFALGAAGGEAPLHLTGATSASLLGSQDKPGRTFPVVTVQVRRLDGVLTTGDIRRPALLKIDTEGYELAVLQGAEGLLAAIDAVIVEVHLGKPHAYRPQQVLDILGQHGFALVDVLGTEIRNHRTTCLDLMFERPAAG